MIALQDGNETPDYVPDYTAASIEKIDFKLLASKGIKYVAFDADSTLVPYRGIEMTPESRRYLLENKKLFKNFVIASNRVTNDLHHIGDSLDISVVRATLFTRKPKRRYFKRVLNFLGARPHEVAMIGDKLMADIWGGNRAGMTTVWVERLGHDGLIDRTFRVRHWEKLFMRRYRK